ncbi:MAG: hypothetical protein ACTSWT_11505, partial [Candidatus Heimdallarchaeota archaeon]
EGAFQIMINVPKAFGGSGEDEQSWMLCDAPTVLYALIKMGWGEDSRIQKAVNHLKGLIRENGWPCAADSIFGKFKGPGKRSDPCPYSNLIALKALAQHRQTRNSSECKTGAETLLQLWEQRKERRPYLFAMGSGFQKLKLPFIWYDILHVVEVLTQFEWLKKDERLLKMIKIVLEKKDEEGKYKPESVWRVWKAWDFGQKREPSPWPQFSGRRCV